MHAVLFLMLSIVVQPRPAIPTAAPAKSVVTACGALTRAEIEGEMGRRVGAPAEDGSGNTCDYAAGNGLVSITLHPLREPISFDAEIASLRTALPRAHISSLRGLGDRAVRVALPGAGVQIHAVLEGRAYVMVSVLGFGSPDEISPAAERLAKRILNVI